MSFLQGIDGTVAMAVLCSLLLAEEAGVPLPFAPGEATLILAGLLIASGGLIPWLFVPCAWLACGLGAWAGYAWARAVGARGLRVVAERLHAERSLARVEDRVRSAGPGGIALTRLVPGLRIYTTLVAGALRVDLRTFMLGALPAMAGWVVVFTVLGALVGLPALHFFGDVERLALRGGILLLIGLGGWMAVRRIAPNAEVESGLVVAPGRYRVAVAALVDGGIVATIVAGLGAVARAAFGLGEQQSWIDLAVIVLVVVVAYVALTRRGPGATAGERLLRTSYRPRRLRLRGGGAAR